MRPYVLIILTIMLCMCISKSYQSRSAVYVNDSLKKQMYQAYLANSISTWKTIENNVSDRYKKNPDNMQALLELTEVQYGLLYCCLAIQAKAVFKKFIDPAMTNVEKLLDANSKWAKAHALKAAILSVEMGFTPAKGMILGPKSGEHIEKAIKYDETEPTAWIQKASSKLHTPDMFGGNTKEAIQYYKKAINLYERNSVLCNNNWQYINSLAWLGKAYTETDNYDKAMKTYKKVLRIEPDFGWVKYKLLRSLKNTIADN